MAEPNSFITYEEWRTKDAIDAHFAKPYVQGLLAAVPPWVAAAPVMTMHEVAISTRM